MAKKRTKADKLQRNVERLEERDDARRESEALEEQIRQRAHALYEARGREDGRDLDDWLQAEAEILGIRRKTTAA